MSTSTRQLRGLSLRELFPDLRLFGADDVRATSCCGDSRSVRPGDVFVAVLGDHEDGHDFAQDAVRRGAAAVVAERPLALGVPFGIVDDSREAYGVLCQALAGNPSKTLKTIGVSGTNGKTTTGILIESVLRAAGRDAVSLTTLGNSETGIRGGGVTATPDPPELAAWMSRMVLSGRSHAVLEASSRALARRQLSGIELDAAVLTNIRKDHLDFHGSVRNYRRAKCRLLNYLKPEGFAVLNADDAATEHLLARFDAPSITYGLRNPAELSAQIIERHASEQTFLLMAGNEAVPVRTRIVGDQHVSNCLAAAAVGLVCGADLTAVVRGLEFVDSLPGRLERIECGQPFAVFVDVARTPDTLAVALHALRGTTRGRLICVFGAHGQSDPETRPWLGRVVERAADLGIITDTNPGPQLARELTGDVLDGYERPARAHVLPDRARAIQFALSQARPGDAVLIAGLGDEPHEATGRRRAALDDRHVARAWLYEPGNQQHEEPTLKIMGVSAN